MDINFKTNRARLMASAATSVMIILTGASFAYAQEADDADSVETVSDAAAAAETEEEGRLETVVVSGFRQSIANSIAAKRQSSSIAEAVSAEDIGKLPDNSIAESLARLPGLTAQRLSGRAQVISVRGLSPDFTTALLNGREQVSAGDNRGVEFDQYPSELLSQAIVYKTPDAALLGQGLAGSVDLRTVRPLSLDGRRVAVSARYEMNDIGALNAGSDDTGYRITGSYVNQFANDTIGIALGVSTQSSPTQAERWDSWGYPTTGNGEFIIGGAKPYVESRTLDRTAVLGTLQYEPSAALRTSIDAFYSKFEDDGVLRGIEIPLFWSGAQLQPGYSVSDGFVDSGVFTGVRGVVRNDARSREADIVSVGGNVEYDLNEAWMLEGDLSYSSVKRDDVDLELYAGLNPAGTLTDTMTFAREDNGNFVFGSQIDYSDPSLILLTDPQGWGQAGYLKRPSTDDELTALRLEATRHVDNGIISDVVFGANYTQREKSRTSEEYFIRLAGGASTAVIPDEYFQGSTALSFLGIPGMVSFDPLSLLNSGIYRFDTQPANSGGASDVLTKSWVVQEDALTAYVKADIESQFYGLPVTGNFGVQFVQTDQQSQGARASNVGITPVDEGDSYNHVLPSLNLRFELPEDTYLRLSVARTLARARMDEIRASQQFSLATDRILYPSELTDADATNNTSQINPATGQYAYNPSGGNPQLRPYVADGYDVSFEKYFGGSGYVSIAAFYKDLKDYVFGGYTEEVDFSNILDASVLTDPSGNPVTAAQLRALNPGIDVALLSRPENGEGGYIRGIELATHMPGDLFLPAPFDGFGVYLSASFTDSEITPNGETQGIDVPGLSKTVGNATLYYENAGFEARISNRFRSDFLGEVTGFGANRDFRYVKGEEVVDAQIGYRFQSGQFEGLSIQLQANNLTDQEFITFLNGDDRQVKDYQRYGTTYLLGVNYSF